MQHRFVDRSVLRGLSLHLVLHLMQSVLELVSCLLELARGIVCSFFESLFKVLQPLLLLCALQHFVANFFAFLWQKLSNILHSSLFSCLPLCMFKITFKLLDFLLWKYLVIRSTHVGLSLNVSHCPVAFVFSPQDSLRFPLPPYLIELDNEVVNELIWQLSYVLPSQSLISHFKGFLRDSVVRFLQLTWHALVHLHRLRCLQCRTSGLHRLVRRLHRHVAWLLLVFSKVCEYLVLGATS